MPQMAPKSNSNQWTFTFSCAWCGLVPKDCRGPEGQPGQLPGEVAKGKEEIIPPKDIEAQKPDLRTANQWNCLEGVLQWGVPRAFPAPQHWGPRAALGKWALGWRGCPTFSALQIWDQAAREVMGRQCFQGPLEISPGCLETGHSSSRRTVTSRSTGLGES